MTSMADETGLIKRPANFVPLTPLSHLLRARDVFPDHPALIYGDTRHTWAEVHERCTRLGSGLRSLGVAPGDVVSTLCPNIPAIVEAHFGVPLSGAVLNTINTRLDVDTVGYIFDHSEAKVALVDTQFLPLAEAAKEKAEGKGPQIVEVPDAPAGYPATGRHPTYEDLIAKGDASMPWHMPQDEWDSIALNYTSGTTGRPKGVVCHHRGAYLITMGTAVSWEFDLRPVYLTIVPLFHCNGWCHTWMMPALGGTIVCCRDITAKAIFDAIDIHKITHFGGAPIVLNTLINAKPEEKKAFDHKLRVITAGAPPSPATIEGAEALGFTVMQVYGLTETYGHVTECIELVWTDMRPLSWKDLPAAGRFEKMARIGVRYPMMEDIDVVDQDTREPVPRDGKTIGEIAIRGNAVMKGYYKNPEATEEAFAGGAFRTGDIAVREPDGYIRITDRMKDIIISGGENISSVEVENTLMSHPAVLLCAVVARPDEKWGETPCAFIELKDGAKADEAEIIAFCRERLAGFKCPKTALFQELPKTSTGKIQKFELRKVAKAL
ncbi:MAG: AMP-binding protein [Rhodobacteraceae bacterium]|nr:AMP-binding protein [Paracoccaceae bacterium]